MATIHTIYGKKGTSYRITVSRGSGPNGTRTRFVRTLRASDLKHKTPAGRLREVQEMAAAWEAELRTGSIKNEARPDKLFLRDVIPGWQDWMEKRMAAGIISPATYRYYKRDLLLYCEEYFKHCTIEQMTDQAAADFVNFLKLDKNYSHKSITHALTAMNSVFNFLITSQHVLQRNPFKGVDVPRGTHEEKAAKALTESELFLLLDILDSEFKSGYKVPQKWRAFFKIMITTGARPGEVLALTWADFQSENGRDVIKIDKAVAAKSDSGWHITKPKTRESVRSVLLSNLVKPDLELHKNQEKALLKKSENEMKRLLVFHGPDHTKVMNGNTPCNILRSIITRWNAEIADEIAHEKDQDKREQLTQKLMPMVRVYDLRHTYATMEIKAGTPANVLARRLGHSTIQMINQVYVHPQDDAFMIDHMAEKIQARDQTKTPER